MKMTFGLAGLLLILAGCSSQFADSKVTVFVDPEGNLTVQNFSLERANMPAFAKEVGNKQVVLAPMGNGNRSADFGKAVEARDALKAAGVKNVSIQVRSDEE